jgi:hypothetical protein
MCHRAYRLGPIAIPWGCSLLVSIGITAPAGTGGALSSAESELRESVLPSSLALLQSLSGGSNV